MRIRRIVLGGLTGLVATVFTFWSGVKFVLDQIGRVSVVQDFSDPNGLMAKAAQWLFATPWWVPVALSLVLVAVLVVYLIRLSTAGAPAITTTAAPLSIAPPTLADCEFFPDRRALQSAHGTLGDRLASTSSVSAIWVIGQKFYHAEENTDRVTKLLLPDPKGKAFQSHIATGPNETAEKLVIDITKLARANGAKVKWYDHFVCHSIILADIDKSDGWMHIESVFPYSKPNDRPSYTVYKRDHEKAVLEMQRIFDQMWEHAHEPRV